MGASAFPAGPGGRWDRAGLDEGLEPGQPLGPEWTIGRDPLVHLAERIRIELANAEPPHPPLDDEPGRPEDPKMARHGGSAGRKPGRHRTDGQRAPAESPEDGPPG